MTSEPRECFVYLTLPGEIAPVTAGRFVLGTTRMGSPQGRFVYARSYLERSSAVPLDPMELKLASRTYTTTALGGMFGAVRDASPDYLGAAAHRVASRAGTAERTALSAALAR